MPAFSFKGQFIDRIEDGTKGGTIRNYGKRNPVLPGQILYLYFGMRTKYCRKIKEAPCVEVWDITVTEKDAVLKAGESQVWIVHPDTLNQFAVSDGFKDWETMKRYWQLNGGLPFKGFHARWIPLKDQVNVRY